MLAPKLLDFYDYRDARACHEMRTTREYLEGFRELDLDRAVLESELGYTRNRIEALELPAVARYAFQVMGNVDSTIGSGTLRTTRGASCCTEWMHTITSRGSTRFHPPRRLRQLSVKTEIKPLRVARVGFKFHNFYLKCTYRLFESLAFCCVLPICENIQSMKDCWRWRALTVEATRLDLEMRKRQVEVREKLAYATR